MDPFSHFVEAQHGVYEQAIDELRDGHKRSHWMWYVFPQLAGLGRSPTAQAYAIADLTQAQAYLGHPVLGPRLVQAALAAAHSPAVTADELLGPVDALKLRSSMTLFALAAADLPDRVEGTAVFEAVLERFYAGLPDPATLTLLAEGPAGPLRDR